MKVEPQQKSWTQTLSPLVGALLPRLTFAAGAAAFAMFVFLKIADEVREGGDVTQADSLILHFFRSHQSAPLHEIMTAVSWLAGPIPQTVLVLVAAAGFAFAHRFKPDGLTMLVAGFGGLALIVGLKAIFQRPRPTEEFAHLWYSFPSGHSFMALTIYGVLAYLLARNAPPRARRWLWGGAIAATLLVGFSRVFLGEHYPSDVAAGYAVAVPWLWGCLSLAGTLNKAKEQHEPR